MAKKKKSSDAIPGFDAIAASRRWRRQTSALLNKMTPKQQMDFLNRRMGNWPAASKGKSVTAIAETLGIMANPEAVAAIKEHKAGKMKFGRLGDIPG